MTPTEYQPSNFNDVWACPTCFALVASPMKHTEWHAILPQPLTAEKFIQITREAERLTRPANHPLAQETT